MMAQRSAAEEAWVRSRADRVRKLPVELVLHRLGFDVLPERAGTSQTFSCSLHGGRDSRPSARTYPGSESWHCFGCGRSRDAVDTVREKMGVGFEQALRWLEGEYRLPPIPRPSREELAEEPEVATPQRSTFEALESEVNAAAVPVLGAEGSRRGIELDLALVCWEVVDRARVDEKFRGEAEPAARALLGRVRGLR